MQRDTKILGSRARTLAAVIITALAGVASIGLAGCDQKQEPPKQAAAAPAAATGPKVHLDKLKWVEMPKAAAQTPFTDAEGKTHALAEFAGKVVLVNFWATWCGPCVEEMPTLDALQATLGGAKFAVIAINQDREGLKVAEPFAKVNAWKNLPLYLEPPGQFQSDADLRGLPTSILIDRQGREVARLEGENAWNAPEMVAAIKEFIDKP